LRSSSQLLLPLLPLPLLFSSFFLGGGGKGKSGLGVVSCCGDDQRDRESVSVCEQEVM
jgi:hypothetical protein